MNGRFSESSEHSKAEEAIFRLTAIETSRLHLWLEFRLEAFAISRGISQEELSSRISEFLFTLQSRPLLRSETDMRVLPRVSTADKPKGQRSKMARHSDARSDVRKKEKVKKNAYWSKMTKAERSAEIRRRMAKRKAAA